MSLSNQLSICGLRLSPGALKFMGVPFLLAIILSTSNTFGQTTTTTAPGTDTATIMRNAKLIYVRGMTVFLEATELENELRKRPEFERWGLAITRDGRDADLVIEVSRKVFTRFVYTVIDPRTDIVVASGKLSSLGGTLSTKIAKRFIKHLQRVRQ